MVDVKQIIRNIEVSVPKMIDTVIKYHPELNDIKDLYELQIFAEKTFHSKDMNRMVQDFIFPEESRKDDAVFCEEQGLDASLVFEVLAHLSIHKRVFIEDMLNHFRSRFESENECIKFFDALVEKNILNLKYGKFVIQEAFCMTDDQEDLLDFCTSSPVMLVKPKKISINSKDQYRNGYLTLNRGIFSKKATSHLEVPVDFLNKQNSMPYWLNFSVWDNYIKYHPEIPSRKDEDDDDTYDGKVQDALTRHMKKWLFIEFYRRFGVEKVYLMNMYCYRGRNYPIAYVINSQGQDSDKALLSFEPKPITEEGFKWLVISIANCFNAKINGVDADKCTFKEREQWFYEEIQPKMGLPKEEFIEWLNEFAEQAESPACFWSQCHNMWHIQKNMRENNEALVWCITHFDATSSGYQIQAIFAKDWQIAELTNLINPKSRKDLYSVLYDELIAHGIPDTYTRNEVKKGGFIPAIYNSINSIKELFPNEEHQEIFYEVMNQFSMWRMNRTFPFLWNRTYTEYSFRYPDGFKVYHEVTDIEHQPAVFQGEEFLFHYRVVTPKKFSCELGPNVTHGWDGYIARELSRAMTFGTKHKNWLLKLRQNKDAWAINNQYVWSEEELKSRKEMRNILALGDRFRMYSLRILTEAKITNIDIIPDEVFDDLFQSLPDDFSWVSEIHDSFGVCPNQAGELMEQYRINLYRLAKSKALPCVLEDYLGYYPDEFDYGRDDEFAEAIKNSVYALC